MKKLREIKVANAPAALVLMKSMLSSNMLDNELQTDESGEYKIRFGWFSRDCDDEDRVGCPCFICEYRGFIPGENEMTNAIVYVKAFGMRNGCMTKMHYIGKDKDKFHFEEIFDNQTFLMAKTGGYQKEMFLYCFGNIANI